jgi:hypothetical protein
MPNSLGAFGYLIRLRMRIQDTKVPRPPPTARACP